MSQESALSNHTLCLGFPGIRIGRLYTRTGNGGITTAIFDNIFQSLEDANDELQKRYKELKKEIASRNANGWITIAGEGQEVRLEDAIIIVYADCTYDIYDPDEISGPFYQDKPVQPSQ